MDKLEQFKDLVIDWELTPEEAVTMYLEWGNNNWHARHAPVRSKEDVSFYFVVDHWEKQPTVRLVKRNSDIAEDLVVMNLPPELEREFLEENKGLKGVSAPNARIRKWLQNQMWN